MVTSVAAANGDLLWSAGGYAIFVFHSSRAAIRPMINLVQKLTTSPSRTVCSSRTIKETRGAAAGSPQDVRTDMSSRTGTAVPDTRLSADRSETRRRYFRYNWCSSDC